jgi:hypothetical protein
MTKHKLNSSILESPFKQIEAMNHVGMTKVLTPLSILPLQNSLQR